MKSFLILAAAVMAVMLMAAGCTSGMVNPTATPLPTLAPTKSPTAMITPTSVPEATPLPAEPTPNPDLLDELEDIVDGSATPMVSPTGAP